MKAIDSINGFPGDLPWCRPILVLALAVGLGSLCVSPAIGCDEVCDGPPGYNVGFGSFVLYSLTTGTENTAVGDGALFSVTTGNYNTAVGSAALNWNTADSNTAVGFAALNINSSGAGNTANGYQALFNNTTGSYNTATGYQALGSFFAPQAQEGSFNVANGANALLYNTTGSYNTASGYNALYSNTTGGFNTASGNSALYTNTSGVFNTAYGGLTLVSNTTGNNNTATGYSALTLNSTGLDNTALGYSALLRNTAGSSNIALGSNAGSNLTTGSNNIDIGNVGVAGESNTIRIGTVRTQTKTFVAGISGVAVTGSTVVVNSSGKLGVTASSARFKQNIKPMDKASEAILALKPVTFNYKKELDPEGTLQFGLVAEEVEKVNPALVDRGPDGKVYTVRYDAVNAMLLNEFLKEHRRVEEKQAAIAQLKSSAAKQEAAISELKKDIGVLTAQLKEQAAQIQKVSAQVEISRPAPQVVINP